MDEFRKPNHYKKASKSGQDVIDVVIDFNLCFMSGNIFKYMVRSGKKEGESELKDWKKILEYAERKVKELEASSGDIIKSVIISKSNL